jgi:hypothetical protein
VSSAGSYVTKFEKMLEEKTGALNAVAVFENIWLGYRGQSGIFPL